MSAECNAMIEAVAFIDCISDFLAGHRRTQWRVGRGDALGGRDDVRRDAVEVRGKQGPQAAETTYDLVHDHEDAGLVADLADALEVVIHGRRYASARILDRFHDDAGDRFGAFKFDDPL